MQCNPCSQPSSREADSKMHPCQDMLFDVHVLTGASVQLYRLRCDALVRMPAGSEAILIPTIKHGRPLHMKATSSSTSMKLQEGSCLRTSLPAENHQSRWTSIKLLLRRPPATQSPQSMGSAWSSATAPNQVQLSRLANLHLSIKSRLECLLRSRILELSDHFSQKLARQLRPPAAQQLPRQLRMELLRKPALRTQHAKRAAAASRRLGTLPMPLKA